MAIAERTLIAACLLGLLAGSARATTVRPRQVVCPVCEREITVLVVRSSNSFGGPDYDLCGHAAGDTPRSFGIWTCPHCSWSRSAGGFEEAPEPGIAERVRKELKPPVPLGPGVSQRDIPGWVKYRLAVTILGWEGADAHELSAFCRGAAWTIRCEGHPALRAVRRDPGLGEHMRALEEAESERSEELVIERPGELFFRCRAAIALAERHLEAASAADAPPREATLRRLLAASALRYRGENLRARAVLEDLAKRADLPGPVRKTVEGLLDSIRREREYQEEWLAHYARALEQGLVDGEDRAVEDYMAGDTLRRLGRTEQGARWIRGALESPDGPAWLTGVATEALARMGVEGPSEPRLAEVRRKRLVRVIARLSDPETAGDADHELRALRDPAALPGILGALDSEHAEVRAAAALTLGFQPEPTDAAIDRLTRLLLEDEEREPRWRAAVSLERIGATRCREALQKALHDETDDSVLRCVVDALGFVGEKESIPAILELYYAEVADLTLALTRLANREVPGELNTRDELLAWWAEHRPGDRKDWVRAGFREAGVEIEDPWSRESVPALLDLLEHERHWIRCNAVRCLREISGRRLPWAEIAWPWNSPRALEERRSARKVWRDWWSGEKPKDAEKK